MVMTERAFKLFLVLVFAASFLLPSSSHGDVGLVPGRDPIGGSAVTWQVFVWYPNEGSGSSRLRGMPLSQADYDEIVRALQLAEIPEPAAPMRTLGFGSHVGVHARSIAVTRKGGEPLWDSLRRALTTTVPGLTLSVIRGADEWDGAIREWLEELCQRGLGSDWGMGGDCKAAPFERLMAGGLTADPGLNPVYRRWLATVGPGAPSRALPDPSASCKTATPRPGWGPALWYYNCTGGRPNRPPVVVDNQPPGCSSPMSRDIPAGPVWGVDGAMLCHLGAKGERSPLCPDGVAALTKSGAVQVPAPFGREWRCYEAPTAPEKGIEPTGPDAVNFCGANLVDYPSECLEVAVYSDPQQALDGMQSIIQGGGSIRTFFPDSGCYVVLYCSASAAGGEK